MTANTRTGRRSNWLRLTRSPLFDIFQFVVLVLVIIVFFVHSTENLGYYWQWYQVPKYIFTFDEQGFSAGPLLDGLWITFKISGISLLLSFVIGLLTALMRLSTSFVAQTMARLYLETIRNTPLLIQLFFIYFVVGPVLGLNRFPSAVLALSLFLGD